MQGSSRMDTLGCGYNASWSLPGGKETEEDVETYRWLMRCSPLCDTTDGTLDGLVHCLLHLHGGEPAIVGGVSVSVHWRVGALA